VALLTDVELGESICTICRSHDVTRDSIRNAPPRNFDWHELASTFESAFNEVQA
jgi:hypothetical protein